MSLKIVTIEVSHGQHIRDCLVHVQAIRDLMTKIFNFKFGISIHDNQIIISVLGGKLSLSDLSSMKFYAMGAAHMVGLSAG